MAEQHDSRHHFAAAQNHLEQVQGALLVNDWGQVATLGLYCLEALIQSLVVFGGGTQVTNDWPRHTRLLSRKYPLPDVSILLENLDAIRKSTARGERDIPTNGMELQGVVFAIEDYFDCVSSILNR